MGYILPVRLYEYTDYQRRMRIDSKDPMEIDKNFRALFASQYHDIAKEYTDPKRDFVNLDEEGGESIEPLEKTYADITGKGRNFNDII